jgi:hypothetical protein
MYLDKKFHEERPPEGQRNDIDAVSGEISGKGGKI